MTPTQAQQDEITSIIATIVPVILENPHFSDAVQKAIDYKREHEQLPEMIVRHYVNDAFGQLESTIEDDPETWEVMRDLCYHASYLHKSSTGDEVSPQELFDDIQHTSYYQSIKDKLEEDDS